MQLNSPTTYLGTYRALVTSVSDPTSTGRIRAQCPQVSGTAELNWAIPVNPGEPAPTVGSIVWVAFNGGDLTKPVFFSNSVPAIPVYTVVQDWTTPVLATGYASNGNSNGTVQYRVLNNLGSIMVEWQGGLAITYSGGALQNGGNYLNTTLPSLARPVAAGTRTVTTACSAVTSVSLSVKIDYSSTGTTSIVKTSTDTPPWISLNGLHYYL